MLQKIIAARSLPVALFRIFILFLSASGLFAQAPTGYTLIKTGLSSLNGNLAWQWIATNNTPQTDNFFILEYLPKGLEILSVSQNGSATARLNSSLPFSGPASLVIGPFLVAAKGSMTFTVSASQQGDNPALDAFALVPQSRLTAAQVSALSSNPSFETPGSQGRGLVLSAVAEPNVSRSGQPVNFSVNLAFPGNINLALFTLAGERLFNSQVEGNAGSNAIVWNLENNGHAGVASGLYLYYLEVVGPDGERETRAGKIAVLR